MLACRDIVTLFLAWLVAVARCQSLPTRDEELFIHQMKNPETFHDSRLIPDGAEVKAYAMTSSLSPYFFLVEEDSTALAITVTPCASPLEWMLSGPIYDMLEEGSASGIEQFEKQWPQRRSSLSMGSPLKTYIGQNVSTHSLSNSPAGIYMLSVRAIEKDSSFMIYATTTPNSDRIYPVLPSDSQVDVTAVRKNRVSLAWKASVSDTVYKQPIKYCVAMNTERNYPTLCSIEARLYGDRRPVVPNTGFGFSSEKNKNIKESRKNRKRKNRRGPPSNGSLLRSESDITFECIGTKTLHTFTDLEPNQKYFFDVFAVDTTTNRSTAYTSVEVVTRPSENDEKVVVLKDGKIIDSSVRPSQPSKTFQIDVGQKTKELLATVQPCSDPVRVEIWRDTELVKSGDVEDLQSFTINNAKGIFDIKIVGTLKLTTHFRVFATTKPRKYPYPRMPEDNRIKPFRNLRECDSLTVAWLISSETAQYCLYKREDTSTKTESDGRKNLRLENTCHGPETRKKSEKVFCQKVHAPSEEDTVMTKMVTGLKQGTGYVFDVYVSRDGKQSLAYRSVKVKTKKYC
ncbi:protein NDNF-like isoform X2 [Anneissia japonica]|nr:protein NDNF-like isoform X2 [Anneissia japonica]XP_033124499.1 protein NDNF-like isoform X2 [Anneissia japonica]